MKRLVTLTALLVLLLPWAGASVSAHGIRYSTGVGGMVITAFFDDGRPAQNMAVAIFAPGTKERFQSGKTDQNGRFVFLPDRTGNWEILIYDRMGHRLRIEMPVDSLTSSWKPPDPEKRDILPKMLIGVCIIAGFFFVLVLRKRGK